MEEEKKEVSEEQINAALEEVLAEESAIENEGSEEIVAKEIVGNDEFRNKIKKLVAEGAKKVNGIRIKNVNITEKDNYTMVGLTLASPIRGRISEDGGITFKEGVTTTLFTSTYALAGVLKEDADLAWMANSLLMHPQALNLILCGSKIDILQKDYVAGEEITNPFSTIPNGTPMVYDHDVIINYIVGIHLGETGKRMSDKLADKLFGF